MKPAKTGIFNQPVRPVNSGKTGSIPKFKPSTDGQRSIPATGLGTYYGTGVRNPMGRIRSSSMGYEPPSSKQVGVPPKSLA